jgi:hypothetical protein
MNNRSKAIQNANVDYLDLDNVRRANAGYRLKGEMHAFEPRM